MLEVTSISCTTCAPFEELYNSTSLDNCSIEIMLYHFIVIFLTMKWRTVDVAKYLSFIVRLRLYGNLRDRYITRRSVQCSASQPLVDGVPATENVGVLFCIPDRGAGF